MKRFTGLYEHPDGRRLTFHVDAENWTEAEDSMDYIGMSGEIVGELIEEGEGEFFTQVGRA